MAEEKASGRGGARKGAGRPKSAPDERKQKVTTQVLEDCAQWLDEKATREKTTVSKAAAAILERAWKRGRNR